MKTYIAQRQINHDNQTYQAGELLELDEKTAKPLLTVGAVEEKPAEISAGDQENKGGDDDGASETVATAADAQAQESANESDTTQGSAADATKEIVGKASKKAK